MLGKDGQQVLLKHGGYYVKVHPCKLRLANCNAQQSSNKEDTTETQQTRSADPSKGRDPLVSMARIQILLTQMMMWYKKEMIVPPQ